MDFAWNDKQLHFPWFSIHHVAICVSRIISESRARAIYMLDRNLCQLSGETPYFILCRYLFLFFPKRLSYWTRLWHPVYIFHDPIVYIYDIHFMLYQRVGFYLWHTLTICTPYWFVMSKVVQYLVSILWQIDSYCMYRVVKTAHINN